MHWVIQQSIFKPANFALLAQTLDNFGVPYTAVSIANGTFDMLPDVDVSGKVYVCGAIKLAKIARDKGWVPGSFLNENFSVDIWLREIGPDLLNAESTRGTLANIKVPAAGKFFIRPLEDNKAFDGTVIDAEMLHAWRRDPGMLQLAQMEVTVSPLREIYREYRLFVVAGRVVTGSVYRIGGRAEISPDVEPYVRDYALEVISRWSPAESFVIDIALTAQGLKVIEFNNINSSGFYASDVGRYVDAIQTQYA